MIAPAGTASRGPRPVPGERLAPFGGPALCARGGMALPLTPFRTAVRLGLATIVARREGVFRAAPALLVQRVRPRGAAP